MRPYPPRRTLTSAWIETWESWRRVGDGKVALSRVRGLKLLSDNLFLDIGASHSHECVD